MPGQHEIDVRIWKPVGGQQDEVRNFFLDNTPALVNSELLYNPMKANEERHRISTANVGKVHLQFDVVLRNLNDHQVRTR